MAYRLLDHTADLRAEVTAPSEDGLYQAGVDLVRGILVGDSAVRASESRRMELAAGEAAERFFCFLRELVYMYDAESFLAAVAADGGRKVIGETFDPGRHRSFHQLKAVTRHGFQFDGRPGCWRAEVVFDT
ncbi:MAG: archease [Anaerolineae bacterium]